MIDVSQEFQEAIENGDRNYLVKVDINPPNLMVVTPFTSKTLNGITIIYNTDGSVTLNGTANENGFSVNVIVNNVTLIADRYRFSGYPNGCSAETYTMKLYTKRGNYYYLWTGYNNETVINTTQRDNETVVAAQIVVQPNVTVSNLVFKPTLGKLSNILSFTKDNLINLSIEDAVSQDNKFTALGGAVINNAIVTIDNSNESYSNYDFKGAIINIKVGLQINGTPEYVDRGVYIVDSVSPKGVGLELSCLDYMSKFDKSFTETAVIYPATIKSIIDDACLKCGVIFTGDYPDSTYELITMPSASTFREVLSAIGQITGTYAHIDRQGKLYFGWFNRDALDIAVNGENGDLLVNDDNTDYQLVFTQAGTIYRGVYTIYSKVAGVHYIDDIISNDYEKDNITIGGVRCYIINEESNEKFEYHYPVTLNSNDFCLDITGNPFVSGSNISEIVDRIGQRIVGLTIRRTKCNHINNPLIEAGDVAMVLYAIKNNTNIYYPIVITRTTFAINQAQETVCGVETLSENLDGRYSDTQLLREQTKKDTNDAKKSADNARKVATNYLSADTTGIMVADLADGVQTPSTATGRNVKIDNTSVYIRDGQSILAQFGDIVIIGKTNESHQQLDYHSLQLINKEQSTYFHVSDLRNKQNIYTAKEKFNGLRYASNGYIGVGMDITTLKSVLINNVERIQDATVDTTFPNRILLTGLNESDNASIEYVTQTEDAIAFTFGHRQDNIGGLSTVFGWYCVASGYVSFAEGLRAQATGYVSHAEGGGSIASNYYSHAEGQSTVASGYASHAEGIETTASNQTAHAEGRYTVASNYYSHAEGYSTTASGYASHAEGTDTVASGNYSHASGWNTVAAGYSQTVIGEYNIVDNSGYYVFIIGNGNGDNARSNAFTVDWSGNVNIPSGTVTALAFVRNHPFTIGTVPSTNSYTSSVLGVDSEGTEVYSLYGIYTTDDRLGTQLEVARTVNGTRIINNFRLFIDADGNRSVTVSDSAIWRSAIGLPIHVEDRGTGTMTIISGSGVVNNNSYLAKRSGIAVWKIIFQLPAGTYAATDYLFTLNPAPVAGTRALVDVAGTTTILVINSDGRVHFNNNKTISGSGNKYVLGEIIYAY